MFLKSCKEDKFRVCKFKWLVILSRNFYWECFWSRDLWIDWVGCVVKIKLIVWFLRVLKIFFGDFFSFFINFWNVWFKLDFVNVLFLLLMFFFLLVGWWWVICIFFVRFLRLSICEKELVIMIELLVFRLFSNDDSCWSFFLFLLLV